MDDLKIIRKKYGEKMMQLCREFFPVILETPGLLSNLMLRCFEPSKFLYDDLVQNSKLEEFRNYIYGFINIEKNNKIIINKTPSELLSEAGYVLYECKTEEEIQYFKKYYAKGEEICTFNGGRLDSCYVFFAVKKNVSEIRREDFVSPKREDEYGTSVISIQFKKTSPNIVSIKNRYNHIVDNPDNTFNNDLDNIIPGLTESFMRHYSYTFKANDVKFEIPGYIIVGGKYYKSNCDVENIHFCSKNIIIEYGNVIDRYYNEPERYILMDYFIIDLKQKTIELYDENIKDSFGTEFKNIENITVIRDKNTGNRTLDILYDGGKKATIVINKLNRMIEYHNDNLFEMNDFYLRYKSELRVFDAPNLIQIGNKCMRDVGQLTNLITPNLMKIGSESVMGARKLENIDAANLEMIDYWSCTELDSLTEIQLINLKKIGDSALTRHSGNFKKIALPNLVEIGRNCLNHIGDVEILDLPNLVKVGEACFCLSYFGTFNAPKLEVIGNMCFNSSSMSCFIAPNLVEIGEKCFDFCYRLKKFYAPKLENIRSEILDKLNGLIEYTDANTNFVKEDLPKNDEFIQENISKVEQAPDTLVIKLYKMLKNNIYKIKGFSKRVIEGIKKK